MFEVRAAVFLENYSRSWKFFLLCHDVTAAWCKEIKKTLFRHYKWNGDAGARRDVLMQVLFKEIITGRRLAAGWFHVRVESDKEPITTGLISSKWQSHFFTSLYCNYESTQRGGRGVGDPAADAVLCSRAGFMWRRSLFINIQNVLRLNLPFLFKNN